MAFSITAWNLNPNRTWFVRLADAGSTISVELYSSLANAQARTNLQASGATTGFGSSMSVTLTNATGAAYPVSLYDATYVWHLQVSGSDGNATKILRVRDFVDLDEIDHAIYHNADLIPLRAAAEINAHTHAQYTRSLECAAPDLTVKEGTVGKIISARRGISELGQVVLHTVSGTPNSLTGSLELITYKALKR